MISSHSDDYGKTDFANLWIRPERGTRATTVAAICYSFCAETLSPAAYSKCQILCQRSILTLSVACRNAQKLHFDVVCRLSQCSKTVPSPALDKLLFFFCRYLQEIEKDITTILACLLCGDGSENGVKIS